MGKRLETIRKEKNEFDQLKIKLSDIPYEEFVNKMKKKKEELKQFQSEQAGIHIVKSNLEDKIRVALYFEKSKVELGSLQYLNYKDHKKDLKKPRDFQ